MKSNNNQASLQLDDDSNTVHCCGDWTWQLLGSLDSKISSWPWPDRDEITIDGTELSSMDSAGAVVLSQQIQALSQKGITVHKQHFSTEQMALMELVISRREAMNKNVPKPSSHYLEQLGKRAIGGISEAGQYLSFVGEIAVAMLANIFQPGRIRWKILFNNVESMGVKALGIITLLSFLIGVVLAYQMGEQLRAYGATIFVADLLGIAQFREFGPLLTAIIVAGRTGSAYTAQIGTMKVNEEVDAVRTLGLSPVDLLVVPKVLALVIAVPLLTIVADIAGIVGGMMMSKVMLGIGYHDFLMRFHEAIGLKTFALGLLKAPIFALVIASIGCFQGFRVEGSAESVGEKTTISVVQAIFLIIAIDAAFSILYSALGV